MITRITTGTAVQITSIVELWVKLAASGFAFLL